MHESLLTELGLSLNEAKVYEALINLNEASVQDISIKSKVHRRNVYDSLSKLIEKGLVSEVFIKGEKNFKSINPERLLNLVKEKEDKLNDVLPKLKEKFNSATQKEQAYIYRGIQGFKNYMQDILEVGEDVYCIGAKGGWYDPRLRFFRLKFYKELKNKNIKVYNLFDHEMKSIRNKEDVFKDFPNLSKFLPKTTSTNSAIDIFGDRVVTFTGLNTYRLDDDLVQFVLISKKLADSYKTWFQFMWSKCK
jgi:sugar-specific transcriptional regulator TrmB